MEHIEFPKMLRRGDDRLVVSSSEEQKVAEKDGFMTSAAAREVAAKANVDSEQKPVVKAKRGAKANVDSE